MAGGGTVLRTMVLNGISPDPRNMLDRLPDVDPPAQFPEDEVAIVDDPAAQIVNMDKHSQDLLSRLRTKFRPDFNGMAALRERVRKAAEGLRPYALAVGLNQKEGFAHPDGDPPDWTPQSYLLSLEAESAVDTLPKTMLWRGDKDTTKGMDSMNKRDEPHVPFPIGRKRQAPRAEDEHVSLYEGLPLGMDGRVLIREIAENLAQSEHLIVLCSKVPTHVWISWFDADQVQEIFVDFFWLTLNSLLLARPDNMDPPPLFSAEELLDNIALNFLNMFIVETTDVGPAEVLTSALFFHAMPYVFACAIHHGFGKATPAGSRTLKHIIVSEKMRRGVCDMLFHWCADTHPPQHLWKILQGLRNPALVLAEEAYEDLLAGRINEIALARVDRRAEAALRAKGKNVDEAIDSIPSGNSELASDNPGPNKLFVPQTRAPSMGDVLSAMHVKRPDSKERVGAKSSFAAVDWKVELENPKVGFDGITRQRFEPMQQSPLLKRSMDIYGLHFIASSRNYPMDLVSQPIEHGLSEEESLAIRARSVLLGLDVGAERRKMEPLGYTELSAISLSEMRGLVRDFRKNLRKLKLSNEQENQKVHDMLATVHSERIRVLSDDLLERYYDKELVKALSNRISGWDVRLAEIKSERAIDARARRA